MAGSNKRDAEFVDWIPEGEEEEQEQEELEEKVDQNTPPRREMNLDGLTDFQRQILNEYKTTRNNILVSAPTGTGKTYLAEIISLLERGRVLYAVPLRALATQITGEINELAGREEATPLISDVYEDDPDELPQRVIVSTYEKLDSSIRKNKEFLNSATLLIVDEIHNTGDKERGPAIENLVQWAIESGIRVIGMSATLPDLAPLQGWLNAVTITKKDRDIPLYRGIRVGRKVMWDDNTVTSLKEDLLAKLYKMGKVVMVFANTRKRAESLYMLYSRVFHDKVVYYHAGMPAPERRQIETDVKQGKYKIIVSTTALGQGVNFPFHTVIFDSIKLPVVEEGRFVGWRMLTRTEFDQICGRAGRKRYDNEGMCIMNATDEREAIHLKKMYFESEYPLIKGHLKLNNFILNYVTRRLNVKVEQITRAVQFTYSLRGTPQQDVEQEIQRLIEHELMGYDELSDEKRVHINPYGRAVAQSYFDVDDAIYYKRYMDSPDELEDAIYRHPQVLTASKGENPSRIVEMWRAGMDEKKILSRSNLAFNDLNRLVRNVTWQTFGVARILRALNKEDARKFELLALSTRYGVPVYALALVQIPGIGRKRAMELLQLGIRNKTELCGSRDRASSVLGPALVHRICVNSRR